MGAFMEAEKAGMKYSFSIGHIDLRKLVRAAGLDNDETGANARRVDFAIDQRQIDANPEFAAEYRVKLGAVTCYGGPDDGIFGRVVFIADLLRDIGIDLAINTGD